MRAVNLIPADAARRSTGAGGLLLAPAYVVLGALGIALVFVTLYVLAGNTVNDRKAKLANLQAQTSAVQAEASRLSTYGQFAQLAQQRMQTIQQIASTRFDWHSALSDLSRVVPANTKLQSLVATVAPGVGVSGPGGSGGGPSSGLRGSSPGPAFELKGCTQSHDDVARLMSRLRLINGVTRVTLEDSIKQEATQAGAAVASPTGSPVGGSSSGGCGSNTPSFDMVVFFQPLPGASAAGAGSTPSAPVSTPAGAATTATAATSTTPSGTAATTTTGGSK